MDTRRRHFGRREIASYGYPVSSPPSSRPVNYIAYSGMEEITSVRGRRRIMALNPVTHYKHDCNLNLKTVTGYIPAAGAHFTFENGVWCAFNSGEKLPVQLRFYGFTLGDFKREAGNLSDQNLLNSLRELKEVPKLFKLRPEDIRPDKLHLMYKFGVQALWNDIKGFYNAAKSFDDRWKMLKANSGKRRQVNLINNRGYRSTTRLATAFGQTDFELRIVGRITNRAQCWVSTKVPESPFAELVYRLDDLGIGKLPSTLWESIPYSFVVDYFLKVGDLLANLDPVGSTFVNYADHFSRSAKLEANYQIVCTRDDLFQGSILKDYVFASGSVKLYQRAQFLDNSRKIEFDIPQGHGILDSRGNYNRDRITTLISLVTSRF